MATMNISLPDTMRDWVETQSNNGQYANNSDYMRDLIRKDQQRADKLKLLQEAITKGIESGPAGTMDIESIKQKARQQAGV